MSLSFVFPARRDDAREEIQTRSIYATACHSKYSLTKTQRARPREARNERDSNYPGSVCRKEIIASYDRISIGHDGENSLCRRIERSARENHARDVKRERPPPIHWSFFEIQGQAGFGRALNCRINLQMMVLGEGEEKNA